MVLSRIQQELLDCRAERQRLEEEVRVLSERLEKEQEAHRAALEEDAARERRVLGGRGPLSGPRLRALTETPNKRDPQSRPISSGIVVSGPD